MTSPKVQMKKGWAVEYKTHIVIFKDRKNAVDLMCGHFDLATFPQGLFRIEFESLATIPKKKGRR